MDDIERDDLLTYDELMTASRYSVVIRWSPLDKVYIAEIPELPAARTHGDTVAAAAEMAHEVAAVWISFSRSSGGKIPAPDLYPDGE